MIDSSYGKAGFSDGLAMTCAWDTPHLNMNCKLVLQFLTRQYKSENASMMLHFEALQLETIHCANSFNTETINADVLTFQRFST